ncbi:MAG TPA: DUF4234 domain-containing protein [Pyrinomonadaceae bacterium]|nr:DUF4234 domain-containing protein [Pyrinomonadaceae bacterium]
MIFCTSCGQQNDDSARVCTNCGRPLPAPSASTPYAPPPGAQQTGSPWETPQYGAPGYGMQPGRAGLYSVGEKRDPIMVLLFSFFTCGIYAIWWWYTIMTEIKNSLGREDINPTTDLVLALVTCGLYGIYLFYKYPQIMLEMQDRVGLPRNDISALSLILAVFGLGIVSVFMVQTELNKIWEAAGRR